MKTTMRAITYTQYGSPDVLKLADVPKPTLTDDEVLVKVHAAATNPADWRLMRATPILARMEAGLLKPRKPILGQDIAGVVEAVGKNVTLLKVGDAVFGELFDKLGGGFAEYASTSEQTIIPMPSNLTFEQAAATPLASVTALQGLRDFGKLKAGESVLINGASGGVGTFAVQIAKALGAEVTTVCSTRNLDLVRSIGADHVIDYTQQDFTDSQRRYDLVFDMVGNRKIGDMKRILKDDGRCVVGGFTSLPQLFHTMIVGAWVSRQGKQQFGQMQSVKSSRDDLLIIKKMIETGQVTPIIDKVYPFEQTADAMSYLEKGRARGKVVLSIIP